MDFLQVMKKKLESLKETPPVIEIGVFNSNSNSVAISPTPGTIKERYLTKDKIYPFSFQILVHHKDNFIAYNLLQQINTHLDNAPNDYVISENDSFKLQDIVCTTTPNFVEKTTYGTLWTAIFKADLLIKGDETQ